jgi:hypothetical protein
VKLIINQITSPFTITPSSKLTLRHMGSICEARHQPIHVAVHRHTK